MEDLLIRILFILSGNFLFLYFFWDRLKEDYTSDFIFSTAFFIITGFILGSLVASIYFPSYWFWAGFLGVMTGVLYGIKKYKFKVTEITEASTVSLLPCMMLYYVFDSIVNKNTVSLFASVVMGLLMILFFVLQKHYRRFTWYRSGRVGFAGLSVLGLFFLIRAAVAVYFPFVLSFAGRHEVYLSSLVSFILFMGVFNLARGKT